MTAPAADGDSGMARALAAGLPADLVAVLAAARLRWRAENEGRRLPVPAGVGGVRSQELWDERLEEAVVHPLAPAYDEVFVAAMRRSRRL